jgi:hypothetical protein
LQQISESRKELNKLRLAFPPKHNIEESDFKIISVVLAFKNNISEQKLRQWLETENDVISICIIGDYNLSKTKNGIEKIEQTSNTLRYWETLYFLGGLYNFLQESILSRKDRIIPQAYFIGIQSNLD